jgi:hypothetical protein
MFLCQLDGIDLEVNWELNDLVNVVYLPFLLSGFKGMLGWKKQVFSCLKVFEDCFPRFFFVAKGNE